MATDLLRCLLAATLLLCAAARAEVAVTDDAGRRIVLPSAATRIISLAPHATELLFAAGAGNRIVGVSDYSDFPADARQLPSVGGSRQLDLERIVALQPDLIVAWQSGNSPKQIARLRALGLAVFESEPRRLDDVATSLERFGTLAGNEQGRLEAARFRSRLAALRERYAQRSPVTVFYQIWPSPLMTLNDRHIVSEAIRLCGGRNVFGQLRVLAPTVSREAVVRTDPDAIFVSDERGEAFERWRTFPRMKAVGGEHLFRIDGSVMNRAGPRLLEATETLCEHIDRARR
jgi:iron complex transport system substrate-binding protein